MEMLLDQNIRDDGRQVVQSPSYYELIEQVR